MRMIDQITRNIGLIFPKGVETNMILNLIFTAYTARQIEDIPPNSRVVVTMFYESPGRIGEHFFTREGSEDRKYKFNAVDLVDVSLLDRVWVEINNFGFCRGSTKDGVSVEIRSKKYEEPGRGWHAGTTYKYLGYEVFAQGQSILYCSEFGRLIEDIDPILP